MTEGLLWIATLGEMVGRVARRASCTSWRPDFMAPGEKRAAMALSVCCVARSVSIGAPMLPSELWRESAGAAIRGTAIIEHPVRLKSISKAAEVERMSLSYRNSVAPAAEPRSSISITEKTRRLQSLISLPSRARSRVWKRRPNPACKRTSCRSRQNEKLRLRSSSNCTICTMCLQASPTATRADEPLSPRLATTIGR